MKREWRKGEEGGREGGKRRNEKKGRVKSQKPKNLEQGVGMLLVVESLDSQHEAWRLSRKAFASTAECGVPCARQRDFGETLGQLT